MLGLWFLIYVNSYNYSEYYYCQSSKRCFKIQWSSKIWLFITANPQYGKCTVLCVGVGVGVCVYLCVYRNICVCHSHQMKLIWNMKCMQNKRIKWKALNRMWDWESGRNRKTWTQPVDIVNCRCDWGVYS